MPSYRSQTAAKLAKALEIVSEEAGRLDLEAQTLRVFMDVIMNPDTAIFRVADRLDISGAAASRNTDYLGSGSLRRPGLGWVLVEPDPMDRRYKRVRLTDKGTQVAKRLLGAIE